MKYQHADEILTTCLYILASHDGTVKERLVSAANELLILNASEFHDAALRGHFEDLRGTLTQVAPKADEGSIVATVHAMNPDDAITTIQSIVALRDTVSRLRREASQ